MTDRRPRTCPRCGVPYIDYPALSRWDNKTYVCPSCGTGEALAQFAAQMAGEDPHEVVSPTACGAAWAFPPNPTTCN